MTRFDQALESPALSTQRRPMRRDLALALMIGAAILLTTVIGFAALGLRGAEPAAANGATDGWYAAIAAGLERSGAPAGAAADVVDGWAAVLDPAPQDVRDGWDAVLVAPRPDIRDGWDHRYFGQDE